MNPHELHNRLLANQAVKEIAIAPEFLSSMNPGDHVDVFPAELEGHEVVEGFIEFSKAPRRLGSGKYLVLDTYDYNELRDDERILTGPNGEESVAVEYQLRRGEHRVYTLPFEAVVIIKNLSRPSLVYAFLNPEFRPERE